jgi:plastocyanin
MTLSLATVRYAAFASLFGLAFALALPPHKVQAAPPRAQSVQIHNFAFSPAVLTVAPGTMVTWVNADEDPHTVTATAKAFHSAALDTGGRFSFTFSRPGEFAYFCSLHPHMIGKIIVRPS